VSVSGVSTTALAIGTVSVAGDIRNGSTFNVPKSVGTFTVARSVTGSRIAAGFATGSFLAKLSAARISASEVTANHIGSISVPGNASRGIVASVADSLFTITGNINNLGLGSFT